MVQHFTCYCFNLSAHLTPRTLETIDFSQPPTPTKDQHKTSAHFPLKSTEFLFQHPELQWRIVKVGELSMAGVHVAQKHLCEAKVYNNRPTTKEEAAVRDPKSIIEWTVVRCKNCSTNLYAISEESPTHIALNGGIVQKSLEERLKDVKKGYIYSKAYRIILEENQEAMNTLLECPNESNKEPFNAFNSLQKQLDQLLQEENRAMEERIEEFRQAQLEQYYKLQSKAYSERKMLWYKMCKLMGWDIQSEDEKAASTLTDGVDTEPVQTFYNKNVLIIEDYHIPGGAKSGTSPQPSASPSNTQLSSSPQKETMSEQQRRVSFSVHPTEISLQHSHSASDPADKSTGIFDFEDETNSHSHSNNNNSNSNGLSTSGSNSNLHNVLKNDTLETRLDLDDDDDESSSLNNSKNEEDVEDEEDIRPRRVYESVSLLGTSLPVNIPSKMPSSFSARAASQKAQRDKEVILSRQFEATSEEELSKSFDVPMSRNRRVIAHN